MALALFLGPCGPSGGLLLAPLRDVWSGEICDLTSWSNISWTWTWMWKCLCTKNLSTYVSELYVCKVVNQFTSSSTSVNVCHALCGQICVSVLSGFYDTPEELLSLFGGWPKSMSKWPGLLNSCYLNSRYPFTWNFLCLYILQKITCYTIFFHVLDISRKRLCVRYFFMNVVGLMKT